MQQLSMLDMLVPPPAPAKEPVRWCDLPRRKVMARAYDGEREFTVVDGQPEPFEIEIRGILCIISYSMGFCTHVIGAPGSPFWSETGFRSFGLDIEEPEAVRAAIERYIDAPTRHGNGCGGKLVRWWPSYVRQWQSDTSWSLTYDRANMWTQWGPEKHAEIWASHDARRAEALARMWAEGIDPNEVGKPQHHKGRWPVFDQGKEAI